MKRVFALFSFFWLTFTAQAQDLRVVSVSPNHGSADVALNTPVSITFNQAINPSDTLLIIPLDENLQQQLRDPSRISISPDGRTITFNVTHQPERDYLWIVFYAKSLGGSSLAERYAFYYTTAATAGEYTVSGQLAEMPIGFPKQTTLPPLRLKQLVHFSNQRIAAKQLEPTALRPKTLPSDHLQSTHLGNWIVVLSQSPSLDSISALSRIAVSAADGTFTLEYVRPGTYYLFALLFKGANQRSIGYGFYDLDRDGEPDSLSVPPSRSGLTIPIIRFIASTALEAAASAQAAVQTVANDAQIVFLQSSEGSEVDSSGRSLSWNFIAYSPSKDTAYSINIFWGSAYSAPTPLSAEPFNQMQPLPLDRMEDSDSMVVAFSRRFPEAKANLRVMAGQLFYLFTYFDFIQPGLYPGDPQLPIWLVQGKRPLPTPLQGVNLEYSVVYNLQGEEQFAYQPVTAKGALQAAWSKVAPSGAGVNDGLLEFSADTIDPWSGEATDWSVRLVSGGQTLQLHLANDLVLRIDTLHEGGESLPKLPYPEMIDSDQAADTARAHHLADFLGSLNWSWPRLEGGFLASRYDLGIDESTPLYGFLIMGGDPWQEGRYFVHMATGTFVTQQIFTGREASPEAPVVGLQAVYPHPIGREATIEIALKQPTFVTLQVYNLLGQEVGRLFEGLLPAGTHGIRWHTETLPAGIYLLQLHHEGRIYHRVVVVRGR